MTKDQLAALQRYISAVVYIMTQQAGDHSGAVREVLAARAKLEAAFGKALPREFPDPLPREYPDLLALPPKPTSGIPDLL